MSLWYTSFIPVNMLKKDIPVDTRNVINKGLCVSGTILANRTGLTRLAAGAYWFMELLDDR